MEVRRGHGREERKKATNENEVKGHIYEYEYV